MHKPCTDSLAFLQNMVSGQFSEKKKGNLLTQKKSLNTIFGFEMVSYQLLVVYFVCMVQFKCE